MSHEIEKLRAEFLADQLATAVGCPPAKLFACGSGNNPYLRHCKQQQQAVCWYLAAVHDYPYPIPAPDPTATEEQAALAAANEEETP